MMSSAETKVPSMIFIFDFILGQRCRQDKEIWHFLLFASLLQYIPPLPLHTGTWIEPPEDKNTQPPNSRVKMAKTRQRFVSLWGSSEFFIAGKRNSKRRFQEQGNGFLTVTRSLHWWRAFFQIPGCSLFPKEYSRYRAWVWISHLIVRNHPPKPIFDGLHS